MKSFFSWASLALLSVSPCFSQGISPEVADSMLKANVVSPQINNGKMDRVYIVAANDKGIKYRQTLIQAEEPTIALSQVKYFVLEPLDYREALDTFKNRQYAKALAAFRAVKAKYASSAELPLSYVGFAEYYESQALKKLENWADFAKVDRAALLKKMPLESLKLQLEVDTLLVRAFHKEWATLQIDVPKFLTSKKSKLNTAQRAEVEYVYGQTLQHTGKVDEAIAQYSNAMVFGAFKAPEMAKLSGLAIVDMLSKKKEVQEFFASNPDPANKKISVPMPVREGAALLYVMKDVFGYIQEVPAPYAAFMPFLQLPAAPKAPEKKPEAAATTPPAAPAAAPAAK